MTPRRTGARGRVVGVVLGVLLVVGAVPTIAYRLHYDVWPGRLHGGRVQFCDRTYRSDGREALTRAQVEARYGAPLVRVGRYPDRDLGPFRSRTVWDLAPDDRPYSCPTTGIWLEDGGDRFVPFGLLGGP